MTDPEIPGVHFLPIRDPVPDESAFSAAERQALDQVNRRIAGAADLEAAVALLAAAMWPVAPCDRFGLAFIDEENGRLVSRVSHAEYAPVLLKPGYSESLHGSSLERVITGNFLRIIDDLADYAARRPQSASSRLLVREGVRSSLTCPLFVDRRVVGVLFRSSRQPHAYEARHVALHLAMAERLGQAIDKAWRIEQLAAANRNYMEMLGFVSHELKSPLAGIVMDADVLTGGYLGALSPEQRDKVARMAAKARHLLDLSKDYLDLARLEGGGMELNLSASVDLRDEILVPALAVASAQFEDQATVVEDQAPPAGALHLACDPELVRIVVVNLLGNAVKYGQHGGHVRIEAGGDGARNLLSVWNEGPGFAPEHRHLLFKRFSRLPEPELKKRKGTGIGLYTCWRIARLHGGLIEAESELGKWARFTLVLPAHPELVCLLPAVAPGDG